MQLKTGELEQQSVVHPHMTLAYYLPPELKLAITSSHARAEEALIRNAGLSPYDYSSPSAMGTFRKEASRAGARIKIGYVSASFKSKAVLYLAQDVIGLHDRARFEVHVYATTPPDDPIFLEKAMRGVDWRQKIRDNVEYFHEADGKDVAQLAELIHGHGLHILIDWDGYSNNGVRATGLFPIQSAPIQVAHQEYVGTMGARYFQYLITDIVSSPDETWKHYAEKLIILPRTFLANSFAYQAPHLEPPLQELPKRRQPAINGCGGARATFVYCNFGKHLKFDPDTFRAWLQTLQAVPGSVLCLLENPVESRENIVSFVKKTDPKLVPRVRFMPFISNPYDNHRRVVDLCNVVLDTTVYNGHTTNAESLWAAVPVVTRSNVVDMSSRVGVSSLMTLGIPELIANSTQEYLELGAKIGLDPVFFKSVRDKLVASTRCSVAEGLPMNPYWDLLRYVRNLENGLERVWRNFLDEKVAENVITGDVGPMLDGAVVCPGVVVVGGRRWERGELYPEDGDSDDVEGGAEGEVGTEKEGEEEEEGGDGGGDGEEEEAPKPKKRRMRKMRAKGKNLKKRRKGRKGRKRRRERRRRTETEEL